MTIKNQELLTLEEQAASDAFNALRVLQFVTMARSHVVNGRTSVRLTMEANGVDRMAGEVSRLLDLTRQEIHATNQPKKGEKIMQEVDINGSTIAEIVELVHQKALANMYAGPAHREESPTLPDLIKSLGVAHVAEALDWVNHDEPDTHERLKSGIRRLRSKTCGARAYMGSDILQIITAFPECDITRTLQLAELERIKKGISRLPESFHHTLATESDNA